MTILFMFTQKDRVIIASDGIAYDENDKVVGQIHTKQIVRPDLNFAACVSSSSSHMAPLLLRHCILQINPRSFDELHAVLPEIVRATVQQMEVVPPIQDHYIIMTYGGFSEEKGRFVGYVLASRSQSGTFEPYVPCCTWTYTSRGLEKRVQSLFGIDHSSANTVRDDVVRDGAYIYALKTLFAARHSKPLSRADEAGSICEVGGFLELTTLSLGHATTSIIYRWPDEVGRIAEPGKDPPIPPMTVNGATWTPPDVSTLYGVQGTSCAA